MKSKYYKLFGVLLVLLISLTVLILSRMGSCKKIKNENFISNKPNNNSIGDSIIDSISDNITSKKHFKIKILNKDPEVILVKNFMTPSECDYVINLGEPHIKKSEVCGRDGSKPDKNRTSMTAHIGKMFLDDDKYDPILANIRRKAGLFSEKYEKNVEPIQLVRYYPGQFFKSHYDYLDRNVDIYKENIEKNGQREFTFFVYLNDVPKGSGGTTHFPKLNKHFKAKKGEAIFWSNMVNGEDDSRMLHSGTELKKGVKYGLNIWVREKEYIGGK